MLPIRTLPPVCETHDKIQVVYKEIRREFTPRQLKVNFIPRKSQNTGELCGKFTISSI